MAKMSEDLQIVTMGEFTHVSHFFMPHARVPGRNDTWAARSMG